MKTNGTKTKKNQMTGTNSDKGSALDAGSFESLYRQQLEFQELIVGKELPLDDIDWFGYHIKAMVEELGELLTSDKRWKTHRNAKFDQENKVEEMCDVFITAMNLAIFSGFDPGMLFDAVSNKIKENTKKWEGKQK